MAGGASEEEARNMALLHLLRKTTMFSPSILLDAGRIVSGLQLPIAMQACRALGKLL